jgi:hypothetical protein
MGKQIQIHLSVEDEEMLTQHLEKRFPVQVVNAVYPGNWDQKTMVRHSDEVNWIIADNRLKEIILQSAHRYQHSDGTVSWRIRSEGSSCIEWSRGFGMNSALNHGRLYVNTFSSPIRSAVNAEVGGDVDRTYRSASAWIRKHCTNCSQYRTPIWVSKSQIQAFRDREERLRLAAACRPQDPRDKRFYDLKKKRLAKLSIDEIDLLIDYCEKMFQYLENDQVSKESWTLYEKELSNQKQQLQTKKQDPA